MSVLVIREPSFPTILLRLSLSLEWLSNLELSPGMQ